MLFFAKMNFLLTHIFLCVRRFLHVHAKFHVFSQSFKAFHTFSLHAISVCAKIVCIGRFSYSILRRILL